MSKGSGILGFMDYTAPIIPQGYHKGKTDKVINKFRENERAYIARIKELDEDLQVVTKQRNALKSLFHEYIDKHGIEVSDEALERDWDRHLSLAKEDN